jgi:hypothetical protein
VPAENVGSVVPMRVTELQNRGVDYESDNAPHEAVRGARTDVTIFGEKTAHPPPGIALALLMVQGLNDYVAHPQMLSIGAA